MKLYVLVDKEALIEVTTPLFIGHLVLSMAALISISPEEAACRNWEPDRDLNITKNLYEIDLKALTVRQIPIPIVKFEKGGD